MKFLSVIRRARTILKYGAIATAVFKALQVFFDELDKISPDETKGE